MSGLFASFGLKRLFQAEKQLFGSNLILHRGAEISLTVHCHRQVIHGWFTHCVAKMASYRHHHCRQNLSMRTAGLELFQGHSSRESTLESSFGQLFTVAFFRPVIYLGCCCCWLLFCNAVLLSRTDSLGSCHLWFYTNDWLFIVYFFNVHCSGILALSADLVLCTIREICVPCFCLYARLKLL